MISLILFHRSLTALKTVFIRQILTSSQQCQLVLRLHLKLSLTIYIKPVGILLQILNKWNQEKVISKREQKFGKHDRGTKLSIVQRAAEHVHECTKCCPRIQNCTFQTVIPYSSAETKRKKQNLQKIILKQLILYYPQLDAKPSTSKCKMKCSPTTRPEGLKFNH